MKRFIYSSLLVGAIALTSGCGKNWLTDLANNPNQPSTAPVQLVLPPILSRYASNLISGHNTEGAWMGYYSYSGGYSVTENTVTYYVDQSTPSSSTGVTWDGIFPIITNANYMEKTAAGQANMEYFVAAAKIMKAFGYQILVDAYGNVPYADAFKGSDNFFPKYDDAKTIYVNCISQLDSAINIIKTTDNTKATNLGNNDIMFRGDMSRWAKFANTLKLRFLIRQSTVVADAKDEIAKTADVGFLTMDAMVNPGYLNSSGKQSPLWGSLGVTPGGALYADGYNYLRGGGAAVNFYKTNSDPRLFYVYAPDNSDPSKPAFTQTDNNPADYHGVYYGDRITAAAQNNKGTVGIGHGVMPGYGASVPLITAAESYFLQSEAVLKGWISGGDDAQTLYQKGITASFEYLYTQAGGKASDADAAAQAYYSQDLPNVKWDNTLQTIITQKWAALAITNNFEVWVEYRRTGFPAADVLPLSKYPGNQRHIPTKFMYPKSEADRNKDAYNTAVGLGNDPQNTKVFWMH